MATKSKPKPRRKRRRSTLADPGVMPQGNVGADGRILPSYELGSDGHPLRPIPGIQISLRLPAEVLAKLERLSRAAVQSKSNYITKLVSEIPELAL